MFNPNPLGVTLVLKVSHIIYGCDTRNLNDAIHFKGFRNLVSLFWGGGLLRTLKAHDMVLHSLKFIVNHTKNIAINMRRWSIKPLYKYLIITYSRVPTSPSGCYNFSKVCEKGFTNLLAYVAQILPICTGKY